jgi:HSP20 family protein
MNLFPWNPFERLEQLRIRTNEAFDRLLGEMTVDAEAGEPIGFHPETDQVESEHEFQLFVSIPGVIEDDLLIEVGERSLTIRGERRPPYDALQRRAARQEWRYGYFERHFELSSPVISTSVRARYDAGVLTIIVEKSSAESGRGPGRRWQRGLAGHEEQE